MQTTAAADSNTNQWVCEGGDVADGVLLACSDLAEDSAHDLAGARLGQVGVDDKIRSGYGPNCLPHRVLQRAIMRIGDDNKDDNEVNYCQDETPSINQYF